MSLRRYVLAVLTVPFLVALGCQPSAQSPGSADAVEPAGPTAAEDRQAIDAVRDSEVETFGAGDIDAILDLFTEDAVLMPPGEAPVVGRAAQRLWLEAFYEQGTVQNGYGDTELELAGDWAFERLSYTMTLSPVGGGEPTTMSGTGFHVYERQADGSWKIAYDIWNVGGPSEEM